jgi:predicted dehydrogenase
MSVSAPIKPFNAAVIGLGGMGKRHLQALQGLTRQVSVSDTRSDAFQGIDEAANRYTQWQELIAQKGSDLDLLIVSTNGPSHAEIVIAAAKAGVRHILCEKPMATSGQSARHMADVCRQTGSRLAINYSRRFMDRYRAFKRSLSEKPIGDIDHLNVTIGSGGLGCIGSHWFDFVEWLLESPPEWVMGSVDKNPAPCVRGEQFFDPGGKGLVRYQSGVTAFFELSGDVPV